MKKIITSILAVVFVLALSFSLIGCGSGDGPTFQQTIDAFVAAGYEVDEESAPFYGMIGASRGVALREAGEEFGNTVTVYEFPNSGTLNTALEGFEAIPEEMRAAIESRGLIMVETSRENADALEIFTGLD